MEYTRQLFSEYGVDVVGRKLYGNDRSQIYLLEDGKYDGPWCIKLLSRVKPYIIPNGVKMVVQRDSLAVLIETIVVSSELKYRASLLGQGGKPTVTCIDKTIMRAFKMVSGKTFTLCNIFATSRRVCRVIYATIRQACSSPLADAKMVREVSEYLRYNKNDLDSPTMDEPAIEPYHLVRQDMDIPSIDIPDVYIPCFGNLDYNID